MALIDDRIAVKMLDALVDNWFGRWPIFIVAVPFCMVAMVLALMR